MDTDAHGSFAKHILADGMLDINARAKECHLLLSGEPLEKSKVVQTLSEQSLACLSGCRLLRDGPPTPDSHDRFLP
jgi:hypothetical protein